MKAWNRVVAHVAWTGLVLSGLQGAVLPATAQQPSAEKPSQSASSSNQTVADPSAKVPEEQARLTELPDSPGAIRSRADGQEQNSPQSSAPPAAAQPDSTQPPSTQPQPAGTSSSQPEQSPPQSSAPQKPVGTAAAETSNASGIAASQPAGVAIAPAKQRRVRTIVLKMGALVGAGVAVGTVVALTAATPSKPPGAH